MRREARFQLYRAVYVVRRVNTEQSVIADTATIRSGLDPLRIRALSIYLMIYLAR